MQRLRSVLSSEGTGGPPWGKRGQQVGSAFVTPQGIAGVYGRQHQVTRLLVCQLLKIICL